MTRIVITYGTFDLFHIGHLRLLSRLRMLGDALVVGVSTDEFNERKGKKAIIKFEDRIEIVRGLKCVDKAIPEESWEQKATDIQKYGISVFGMGGDWEGKFDHLRELCEVVYLPRTENISSTQIKQILSITERTHMDNHKKELEVISAIVDRLA